MLLASGTYLALFFDPSMEEVIYEGSYALARSLEMTRAYASTLVLSFEVRGGLFVRQLHHWAALVFMAAIVIHRTKASRSTAPRSAGYVRNISTTGIASPFW